MECKEVKGLMWCLGLDAGDMIIKLTHLCCSVARPVAGARPPEFASWL